MSTGPTPSRDTPAPGGLLSGDALTFLALIALPVLAFVCAVFGLILVLQGKTIAGLVFLLVLTQAFAIGGFMLGNRRKRAQRDR
ncbi:NF038396 family protein [Micrococcus sp. M4NT]|uniref:NF038396 family protein n=1 Tax=Micrococcus sp. M4NT TaxID=2957501 RepID=UPI0029B84B3F|nr:NF038396 family protein [Micrococcus sp. M4NT]MDX2340190.1 NF038396 family protein [Micrococcus sp. M4NT]